MSIRISELTDAGALLGGELLELSVPSLTVTMTETTISAHADSNGGHFSDSGSGFVAAGFGVGDSVRVQGFTGDVANNIFSGRITDLTAGEMTIGGADGDVIVDDAAGEPVTITRWESARTNARALDRTAVTVLTSSSGVVNINCALGDYFTLALSENVTSITFSNLPPSGFGATMWLQITQDGTPRTVAWPASFKWAGGAAGAVSTGSGANDVLCITSVDSGTSWQATLAKAFA